MKYSNNMYDIIANMLYKQNFTPFERNEILNQFDLTTEQKLIVTHRMMEKELIDGKKINKKIEDVIQSEEIKETIQKELHNAIQNIIK